MEPNLSQALHLLNGTTVEGKIREGGVLKSLTNAQQKREQVIEELYLRCFARKPSEAELTKLLSFFKETKDAKLEEQTLSDVFWALLNSKEFVFNH